MIVIDNETWVYAHAALGYVLDRQNLKPEQLAAFRAARWRLEVAHGVAKDFKEDVPCLLQPQAG